jgi:outer membrane protein OmpA-like peptidoglycan-associated protein
MKKLLAIVFLLVFGFSLAQAQIVDPETVVKKQGTKRTNRKIEKGVDKGFDKLEEGFGRLFGKKKKKRKKGNRSSQKHNKTKDYRSYGRSQNKNTDSSNAQNRKNETITPKKPQVVWSKFDFVPGDEVIFEDAPSADEENGEFPSRWDLVKGQVEIATVNGVNVMMFIGGNPEIVPYLKNSKEDYLPEVFTIEFDFFKPVNGNRITVYLYDTKNQRRVNSMNMDISSGAISEDLSGVSGDVMGIDYRNSKDARWIHVSIAFTKGKLKVYVDDTRVINIPHYSGNPSGLTLQAYFAKLDADKPFYFKNIRIAKGGVKYYDRLLQDGKIIVNGIRFDTGKATIKPESMGAINKIYQLMQKQADLNFSVEGHTDADGDDASNMSLSKARGKAVMQRLTEMGISSDRLKYNGFGESKPIDNNSTAEGKANNRRVEFVKFTSSTSSSSNVGNSNGNSSNSAFDKLNRKSIGDKLETLPNERIQVSIPSGILLDVGTIIGYATKDGRVGKMEFLNIDKNDNYKLTVKYVTYNFNGSIYSQSNHLEIEGTQSCDLDDGTTEVTSGDEDFQLGRTDKTNTVIWAGEESILRVFK